MSAHADADELFAKGLALLKTNNPLGALACFEKAYAIAKKPAITSCLGLCIATERGSVSEAVRLCREAIEQDPQNPLHYLNLGKVYLKAGNRSDCAVLLRQGLSFGEDPEISALLESLGLRKPPVFSLFRREHFLNKYAGIVLSWLRLR